MRLWVDELVNIASLTVKTAAVPYDVSQLLTPKNVKWVTR